MRTVFLNDDNSTRFLLLALAVDRNEKGYWMITAAWWKWQIVFHLHNANNERQL